MIDYDATIAALESQDSFDIEFAEEDEESYFFTIKVKQRKQRRLINRYIRTIAERKKDASDDEMQIEITTGFYELGIALAEDCIAWQNITGDFTKAKAKRWMELNGAAAEELGRQFKDKLDEYETILRKHREVLVKN